MIPLSACLMDKLCLGCGPASPPSLSASSRAVEAKRQRCVQTQQLPQQQQEESPQRQSPSAPGSSSAAATSAIPASASSTKPGSDPSSSSSSSSSRRESRGDPFAVSSHQRNTVIRLSPDEPSTTTISTSTAAADHPSTETTLISQPEASPPSSSLEPEDGGARESVILEAREIVERIKRTERMKVVEREADETTGENGDAGESAEEAIDPVEELEPSVSRADVTAPESAPLQNNRQQPGEIPSSPVVTDENGGDRLLEHREEPTEKINGDCDVDVRDEMIVKDGKFFSEIVLSHESRIKNLCVELESFMAGPSTGSVAATAASSIPPSITATDTTVPEEICGKIRACIGKANLLTTKKFKQFKGLCEKNLSPPESDPFPTTDDDLAGFWDLVMMQIEEIDSTYDEIVKLRTNGWKREEEKKRPVKRIVKSAAKNEKSAEAVAAAAARAKAREDARKKLINSKRLQHMQQKVIQDPGENAV